MQRLPCCPVEVVSAFHSLGQLMNLFIHRNNLFGSGLAIPWLTTKSIPSGIILHLDYPNCFESQGAFNPDHIEHTSLPHCSDVFLGVMDQQPSPCKSFCYVQETKNSKFKRRRLIPAHRLCDKDPNNLKAVLITII